MAVSNYISTFKTKKWRMILNLYFVILFTLSVLSPILMICPRGQNPRLKFIFKLNVGICKFLFYAWKLVWHREDTYLSQNQANCSDMPAVEILILYRDSCCRVLILPRFCIMIASLTCVKNCVSAFID
jgi:hypothetical protein